MNPRPDASSLSDYYIAEYRLQVQGQEDPTAKDRWAQSKRAQNIVRLARPLVHEVETHLDIGSSLGELLAAFHAEYGCAGIGVEPGRDYRQRNKERGQLVYADLGGLPLEARSSFDAVTMVHVLEHLPDPLAYLREIREDWLKPRGHLILEVPNLLGHPSLEVSHLTAYDRTSLEMLLRDAGYCVLLTTAHGRPHSRFLPLFLFVVATTCGEDQGAALARRPARALKFRRFLGLQALRAARALGVLLLGKRQLRPWEE